MTKILLAIGAITLPFISNAQIFQEDFDGNGPGIGAWTVIDVDGKTPNSKVAFITNGWNAIDRKGENGNFGGPEGNYAAMSTSWYDPAGTSNDWLISPAVIISGTEPHLQWEAKAQDKEYPDGYKVMLSPNGGNTVADFTVELFSTNGESGDWKKRNINLSSYMGQNIRFAFVNNSTDKFMLMVDNIKVGEFTPVEKPNCATLVSPANNAVDISYLPNAAFSWTASTTGGAATGYDFYLSTEPTASEKLGTATGTSVTVSGLLALTKYYWKVVPVNDGGEAASCQIYSFTTEASAFSPYCGPLGFSSEFFGMVFDGTEAISYVDFAGIQNRTDEDAEETPHEIFLDKVASVAKGSTHEIKVEGNTGGNYDTKVVVFVDWNQNGVLNDPGEVYEIADLLSNSTGADGVQVKTNITVPADALTGPTRMRVKKIGFSSSDNPAAFLDPCAGASYGQAEDYTVNVGNLAVNDINKAKVQAYPNPVTDLLKITTGTNAKNITVFDITGKKVLTQTATSSNNEVNMSKVAPGAYVVIVETENGAETIKVIKK